MARSTLPGELWNNIAHHCRRRDLRSLARANKTTLYAARPVLFQELIIEQRTMHKNPALLSLLEKDRALRTAVKHILVVTQWAHNDSWISVEFLRSFNHADSISLEGWPFRVNDEEEKAFLSLMCTGQWKSFAYKQALLEIPNFEQMGWGKITGLKRILLASPGTSHANETYRVFLLIGKLIFDSQGILDNASSFLHSSASTITHLTLPREMWDYHTAALEKLLDDNTKFPNLCFFECGGYLIGEDTSLPWEMLDLVTRFLSLHPTVEHLRIPCDDGYCTIGLHSSLGSAGLNPDFLPSLKKLDAHVDAIEVMAKHRVKSLATVEEVITGDWSHLGPIQSDSQHEITTEGVENSITEGIQSMDRFLATVLEHGGLPGVKRFTMTVGPKCDTIDYSRLTPHQMGMMAKMLPSVEEWTGNGNGFDGATEKTLADMFRPFSMLKKVRLRGMEPNKGVMRAIARAVPTLRSFYYEDPADRRDDEWLTFDVIRLSNNRIVFSEGTVVDAM